MEIKFQTKEESNKLQQEEFLKLTGDERFHSFLKLSYQLRNLPQKEKTQNSSPNFQIIISNGKSME